MKKIIHISDTHTKHQGIQIEECDILIHSGDITSYGEWWSTIEFLKWFDQQPAKYKIFIAGNHDFNFDFNWKPYTERGKQRHSHTSFTKESVDEKLKDFPNIIYLNDSGVTIEGLNIWGSPITPWFHDWAFNRMRNQDIQEHWDMIPDNTDVLITHGPPFKIGDLCAHGGVVGCEELLEQIKTRLKNLKLHCFGHIHESYGVTFQNLGNLEILFSNACILNENYYVRNKPIIIELDKDRNIVNHVN